MSDPLRALLEEPGLKKHTRSCSHCGGHGRVVSDEALGAEMRARRTDRQLSIGAIARRMGFSRPYVNDLELGERPWRPELITAYLKALDAS